MGKLSVYILVISGVTLLFYFSGLMGSTADICDSANPNNALLCLLLSPEDMPRTDFTNINSISVIAIQGIVGLGVVIGAFFTGQIELAIISPVAIFLFNLLWNVISIFNKVREVNPVIAVIFIAPMLLLFILVIVDWWRGRDT